MSQAPKKRNPDIEKKALHLDYSFNWDVDFDNRVIRIGEEIESGAWAMLDAAMTELESMSRKTITIKINSPGGDVYEALAMVGRIKASTCKIVTEGYGHIMSAAIVLLSSGDRRCMSEYAWFMHHEMSYGVEGSHSDIKEAVHQAERESQQWAKVMSEFSNQDASYWLKLSYKNEAYLTAAQCIQLGVIDEII